MVKILICLIISIFTKGFSEHSLKHFQQEGKEFGKLQEKEAKRFSKEISPNDLLPKEQKGKFFDPEEAKKKIESESWDSDVLDFIVSDAVLINTKENKGFHEEEAFLKKSEEIAKQADNRTDILEEESIESEIHQCKESGDPFIISFTRDLIVEIADQGSLCEGHQATFSHSNAFEAAKTLKDYKDKLSKDASIKWYDVQISGGGMGSSYTVTAKWKHIDGTSTCDNRQSQFEITKEEWVYDNQNYFTLSQQPDCTLIEQVCLDENTTKTINGKSIARKCWKERLSFIYQFPQIKDCLFLKTNYCEQISQNCIQPTAFGCALWEKSFKCFSKIIKSTQITSDIEGLNDSDWKTEYQPNSSFADVAIKLSVLQEAEKDLKKCNTFDANKLTVFNGEKIQCSKNVSGDLIYDCCFNYSGLAKQMGLSKCNAEEISLAERREKGLCHYVGSYEEKILGLLKSRDEHVFCCYSTKLARVVQEEGRKQLRREWGTPKKPDCAGFTMQELSQLNFSKMDLTEALDQFPRNLPEGFDQKIEVFQNRIQEQVEKDKDGRDEGL